MRKRTAEVIQLENEIRTHDHSYWVLNRPLINDPIYDQIVNRLLAIDPDNEYLKKVHTPKVQSDGKVTHIVKMLSLDKAYEYNEIVKWADKIARTPDEVFRLMPKFDGVSGQKKNNVLATRGDGEIGEDITHKLSFMNILTKGDSEDMRGEILFTKSKFQEIKGKITRKSGEDYKNERNAVGGILSRDDLEPSKILTFVDFEYIYDDLTLTQLKGFGEENWEVFILATKNMDFPTDGMVLKVLDLKYAESLGATRHHSKSAMAFKFENPFGWSEVIDIVLQQGKHELTPVIKVKPVVVSGTEITSPTGHNWRRVLDFDIRKGDMVKIERAGDVIPYISECKPGENRKKIDCSICPACGESTIFVDPQLECSNENCEGKLLNKLSDAVIRIGIDRLGKPTIQKMIDTLKVENLIDIFNVTYDDLLTLDRFGEKSAENLFNEIKKVKEEGVFEWQILACLNIPGIGRSLSKDLLKDRTLFQLISMYKPELVTLENIGEERADAIINGIFDNIDFIGLMCKILPCKDEPIETSTEDLIKVCFTGKFPKKKSYYYDLLKEHGGYEIMEKVSKDTQMLIVGDSTKESNKTKSAKKKGIQIVGIYELLLKLN
jgi:DNA ligase (NAD+)